MVESAATALAAALTVVAAPATQNSAVVVNPSSAPRLALSQIGENWMKLVLVLLVSLIYRKK